jgi:DDE superfamily endonuclease
MSKNWEERIQFKVISEMIQLCGDVGDEDNPIHMSVRSATRRVSGEDGFHFERASEMALITVSSSTIRRWYDLWIDYKILPCKIPPKWLIDSIDDNRCWRPEEVAQLKDVVDAAPFLYLDELSKIMTSKLGRKITGKAISYCLRERLGYSRKVIFMKASQYIEQDKINFIETLRNLVDTPEMIIFIDESHKDKNSARRKYGWSKKGTAVNYKGMFNLDRRYTLVGVADCFGFVVEACETVQHNVMDKEEEKPLDADKFVEIFERSICPVLGNYSRGEPRSVIVFDNCTIHMDPRIKALADARGAIIVYSAPYCPEVIPLEYMFHQWKEFLRHHSREFDRNWFLVHLLALESITPQQGMNYFKKTTIVELVEKLRPLDGNTDDAVVAAAVVVVLRECDVL